MKQPIPFDGPDPLLPGDRVEILPQWQDSGDSEFDRVVVEAPADSTRVLIATLIPGFAIPPTEWIEADHLKPSLRAHK